MFWCKIKWSHGSQTSLANSSLPYSLSLFVVSSFPSLIVAVGQPPHACDGTRWAWPGRGGAGAREPGEAARSRGAEPSRQIEAWRRARNNRWGDFWRASVHLFHLCAYAIDRHARADEREPWTAESGVKSHCDDARSLDDRDQRRPAR